MRHTVAFLACVLVAAPACDPKGSGEERIAISGKWKTNKLTADSGNLVAFHFDINADSSEFYGHGSYTVDYETENATFTPHLYLMKGDYVSPNLSMEFRRGGGGTLSPYPIKFDCEAQSENLLTCDIEGKFSYKGVEFTRGEP